MTDREAPSTSSFIHPSWCLGGIVVVFIAYSLALFWCLPDDVPELLELVGAGAWVMQAHLFATWAALGPGNSVLRVPPLVAVFLTVLGAPAVHPDGQYERGEFIAIVLTGASIFAITTVLLVVVQRFVRWRIEFTRAASPNLDSRYRFCTWYLIALTTLYAVVLGVYTNIVFRTPEPPPWGIFGPDFVVGIVVYAGTTAAILLLPVIAVPMLVLSRRRTKRAVVAALSFWFVGTAGVMAFWHVVDDKGGSDIWEMLLGVMLVQVGGVVMSLVAALPLRLAGYRLVRSRAHPSSAPPMNGISGGS